MKALKNAKEMEKEVFEFALPEGRMVGTEGHEKAKRYIVSRMSDMGLAPYSGNSYELPYTSMKTEFCNIVGEVKSAHPEKAPLLIGAHYDSVLAGCCADDNAAAVIIALAAGEYFMSIKEELDRDIVIAIFDAEEPPYFHCNEMGSNWFYEHQKDSRGFHSAFIMDLVGHDLVVPQMILDEIKNIPLIGLGVNAAASKLRGLCFVTGAESAPEMTELFAKNKSPKGLRMVNALNKYVGDMSDHGAFRNDGVPFLFFSCGRWEHYHRESDTPEKLSYKKMANILRYLVSLSECASGMELTHNADNPDNSVELEAESLKKAFSPMTPFILKYLGMKSLESREDIDSIAQTLISLGL